MLNKCEEENDDGGDGSGGDDDGDLGPESTPVGNLSTSMPI